MKRYLLLALFLAVIQYSQGQSSKKSYTNPICTEDGKALHVADPFIYEHEGTYYLTGTTDVNMGFDYYTSHDLVTWKFGGAPFIPAQIVSGFRKSGSTRVVSTYVQLLVR